jgi:hypothetical protein
MDIDRISTETLADLYEMRSRQLQSLKNDLRYFRRKIKHALSEKDKSMYMQLRKKTKEAALLKEKTQESFYVIEDELSARLCKNPK